MRDNLVDKVLWEVRKQQLISEGDRIVVGISGGADSVCLLSILNEWKQQMRLSLFGVHVHHGIRGVDADEDAEFARKLCTQYDVPFYEFRGDVPAMAKEEGMTEEEAGRKYRYTCFAKVMKEQAAHKLATAHHMDDQAETVLFHLIRGTNLSGMGGMAYQDAMWLGTDKDCVIRPLLGCRKTEIVSFLKTREIVWKEDVTNQDICYARNHLRLNVLPSLAQVNDQAVGHIAQFAASAREYEQFFREMVADYIEKYVVFGKSCETEANRLRAQNPMLARAVIYQMICTAGGSKKDVTREHVDIVYGLLEKQSGKRVVLKQGILAILSYETLMIRKSLEDDEITPFCYEIVKEELVDKQKMNFELPGIGNITLRLIANTDENAAIGLGKTIDGNSKNNYTKIFDYDKIKDTLRLRMARSSDYLIINNQGQRKKISRYFIDAKIPADMRKRAVVLALGDEVLWHIGGRRGERYKVDSTTRCVLVVNYKGEEHGRYD